MDLNTPLPRRNKDLMAALDSDEDSNTPFNQKRSEARGAAMHIKDKLRGKENEPLSNMPMEML